MCKMHVKVIRPYPSAMLSLNKQLFDKTKTMEYIFSRPLMKQVIFPANQSSLVIENPFNNVIPGTMYIFILSQKNLNGSYKTNSMYLEHANMSSIKVEIDGSVHSALSTSFPNAVASLFYNTLSVIGNDNLLNYENFRSGRTLLCYNLKNSDRSDTLDIERTGSMRISINTSNPLTSNHVLFVVGLTNAVIEIDGNRNVSKRYLM